MLFNELKEIIIKNNLIEKSKENFWIAFHNYCREDPDEAGEIFNSCDMERINIFVNNVSFQAHNWPDDDRCFIVIDIAIEYNDKAVGYYDVLYTLDGHVDDDFFVIY